MTNLTNKRSDVLEGAPLRYSPTNEFGVVFLFAHLAKRWRLRIDSVQAAFPDCIAYQKVQGGEKKIRIEFEYKSRNFKTHGHSSRGCDWIVCWEHNWPDAPKHLKIIELRREYGLGFNIWIVPVGEAYKDQLKRVKTREKWSTPSQSHKDDLVLFYLNSPDKCISDIFMLTERTSHIKAGWKKGKDYMATIKRIGRLKSPIFLEDMKSHRILSTANFVRASMQGRHNATEYWPYLYDMIIRRNHDLKHKLRKYDPEKLC